MKKRSNNHMDVLICYTSLDENFLDLLLKRCLSELGQEKLIGTIFSVMIDVVDDHTRMSLDNVFPSIQIVLILICQEFLSTSFVTSARMKLLLEKHTLGELRVIPVVLNPVIWKG